MSAVSKNSFQRRLNKQNRTLLTPDSNAVLETQCRILRVYDAESGNYEEFPPRVRELIAAKPGLLFCLVELLNGARVVVPMDESADQIYSTYGNSAVLENSIGRIRYRNYDVASGTVSPARHSRAAGVDVSAASNVADIGAIIGI